MDKIKEKFSKTDSAKELANSAEIEKSELFDEELEEIAGGKHQMAENSVKTRCNL